LQRRARRRPCTITSQRYALLWPWRRCKFLAGHPKPAAPASMRHYVNTLISHSFQLQWSVAFAPMVPRTFENDAWHNRMLRTAQNLLATTSTAQRAQWVPRRVDLCPRGHTVAVHRAPCLAASASPPYRWSCRHAHTAVAQTSRNTGRSKPRSEGDAVLWTRARTRLSDLRSCTGSTTGIVADGRLGPSDASAPTRTHHACLECRACRPVSFQGLGPADRF
jgi:hypothetical protein